MYLDASAIVPIFLKDPHVAAMERWLLQRHRLVLSDFAGAEFVGVVARFHRMKALGERDALAVLSRFDAWRSQAVTVRLTSPRDIAACDRLVRQFKLKLTVADALHLAIAMADEIPLVTFDRSLAAAASQAGHSAVVP